MDRDQIESRIPHRDPFLWIDRVSESGPDWLTAEKFVDPDLDVFRGHYPGRPILPGVLICEAAFQAGALLISELADLEDDRVPVVTRLNNVKFRRVVRPGDLLQIHVQLDEVVSSAFFLKATVKVDGQVAVRLEFGCTAASFDD